MYFRSFAVSKLRDIGALSAFDWNMLLALCCGLSGAHGQNRMSDFTVSSFVVSVKFCSITSKWATWLSWWKCYCDEALFVAWHPSKLQFRVGS